MRDDEQDLRGLVGSSEAEARSRLGEPLTRRLAGGDVWLVFDTLPGRLRIRCPLDATGTPRVASWTLKFVRRHPTLSEAACAVGLWPAAAPDVRAPDVDAPLVRRPLRAADGEGGLLSLTATVRDGGFDRLTVFDESPDWL